LRNNIFARGTQGQNGRECHAKTRDEGVSRDTHDISLQWLLIQRSMRK
jgi:hypothetical protein